VHEPGQGVRDTPVSMETVIAILLVAVSLVFLSVALDATRYPK
jgi:hypothetical protein